MIIDEQGQIVDPNTNDDQSPPPQLQSRQPDNNNNTITDTKKKSDKSYSPLNKYKTTGQLIYEDEYLNL